MAGEPMEERIRRAATRTDDESSFDGAVRAMWANVQSANDAQGRKRYGRGQLAIAIVAAAAVGGLITGAAPLVDEALNPDVVIGIGYETSQGDEIKCSVRVSGGSLLDPGSSEVARRLREIEWTDIGEEIHARAVQLAGEGTQLGDVQAWAWSFAETELIVGQVQDGLPPAEYSVMSSTCPRTL